jgi:DNA-binding SARP family transcriptional activator/TolB-like protein
MIVIQLLGALHAAAPQGRDLGHLIAQPRRFALLAYLAAAASPGFRRRDTLLSVFWPEADLAHARGALRKALHFLRCQLGPGVLVSRGDEEIGLAEQAVWCDAAEFERAVAGERLAEALELYRGDLLPGFFVSGAPAFESWLDEERHRLRVKASQVAWELSSQLAESGDRVGAARWARWAHGLVPADEISLRRLIDLLGRLGDRAGAVHAYHEFAERLWRDYELTPSADTQALVNALHERGASAKRSSTPQAPSDDPPTSAAPDDASVQPPASRVNGATPITDPAPRYVAVFPFSVYGGNTGGYLGEGLVDLLSSNFDGAGLLRSVDPHALLSLVQREGPERLGPERARALARRFGAELFVLGNVIDAAGRLRVSASLYGDEPTGAPLRSVAHANVDGASQQLFELVDDLTAKLLAGLRGGHDARLARLAATTTTSFAALKAYLAGESHSRAGRAAEAMAAYREAVEHDPTFALAWYHLAVFLSWPLTPGQSWMTPEAEQALRFKDRLARRDRLLVEALHASLRGQGDEAERLYHEVLALHPEDVEAWIRLGESLGFHNPQSGRLSVEAREPMERAFALDPGNWTAMIYLCYQAGLEGRHDEYDALVDRLGTQADYVIYPRVVRAFRRGDHQAQAEAMAALRAAPDSAVYEAARFVAVLTHDYGGARTVARLLAEPTRSPEVRAMSHVLDAFLELAAGRPRSARDQLANAAPRQAAAALEYQALLAALPFLPVRDADLEALRRRLRDWDADAVPPSTHPSPTFDLHRDAHPVLRLYLLGALGARLRDPGALGCADELDTVRAEPAAAALSRDLAHSVRAQLAWWRGQDAAALAALEQTRVQPPRMLIVLQSPFYTEVLERWLRAELLERLGRYDEALRWYQAVAQNSIYELPFLAPSHLRRAEIHDRLGQPGPAAEHYAQFVALWRDCDEDLRPTVAEAARRLASLRGTERGTERGTDDARLSRAQLRIAPPGGADARG